MQTSTADPVYGMPSEWTNRPRDHDAVTQGVNVAMTNTGAS